NNVGRLDITMNNRGLLCMQIGNGLDNGSHHFEYLRQGVAFAGLLFAQDIEILTVNIFHKNVGTPPLIILKDALDMGKCRMVQTGEYLTLKGETDTFLLILVG